MFGAGKRSSGVVLVTGASAGVGRAIVREFAQRGASVGLLARGRDGLEAACREVESAGGKALAVPTDVADADQVSAAADAVERELGPIDVWVNNAMVSVLSPVKDMTAAEFRRVTEVTYLGYVHGTLAALRSLLPRNRGLIIQVGSALAYRSIPLQSACCGAKHAIIGFTESLRCEMIHDRRAVQVAMVQLPAINTPQFSWIKSRMPRHPQPVPPIYQPEVIAKAVVWMADHPRREMWIGWPTVKAIVGEKVIPGLLDHYLASVAYDSQQTSEFPFHPDRPDNLYHPLKGDYGAHGKFDSRAYDFSPQLWMNRHRSLLAVLGIGLLSAFAWRARRSANASLTSW